MNLTRMKELASATICADCGQKAPDWTSINLGIFICINCAGIHRNLGVHISQVRSIDLDTQCWTADGIKIFEEVGNEKSNAKYEHNLPAYFMRPGDSECALVREYFIRAKYERKEFINTADLEEKERKEREGKQGCNVWRMPEKARHGFLLKANGKGSWQKRWFVLQGRYFSYYKETTDSYAKGTIDVTQMKIVIQESSGSFSSSSAPKGAPRFWFELHVNKSGIKYDGDDEKESTDSSEEVRVMPLGAETLEDMFNWIHTLKRVSFFYTTPSLLKGLTIRKHTLSQLSESSDLALKSVGKPLKSGFLSKQGGRWQTWNKRFFILTKDALYYWKNTPQEEDVSEGCFSLQGADVFTDESLTKKKFALMILTPERHYFLAASSASECEEWRKEIMVQITQLQQSKMVDFARPPDYLYSEK